jgi:hypothetical protein
VDIDTNLRIYITLLRRGLTPIPAVHAEINNRLTSDASKMLNMLEVSYVVSATDYVRIYKLIASSTSNTIS